MQNATLADVHVPVKQGLVIELFLEGEAHVNGHAEKKIVRKRLLPVAEHVATDGQLVADFARAADHDVSREAVDAGIIFAERAIPRKAGLGLLEIWILARSARLAHLVKNVLKAEREVFVLEHFGPEELEALFVVVRALGFLLLGRQLESGPGQDSTNTVAVGGHLRSQFVRFIKPVLDPEFKERLAVAFEQRLRGQLAANLHLLGVALNNGLMVFVLARHLKLALRGHRHGAVIFFFDVIHAFYSLYQLVGGTYGFICQCRLDADLAGLNGIPCWFHELFRISSDFIEVGN